MDLNYISNQQGYIWNWYIFHDPFTFLAFWTYFTCATAQCKRAPFDLAEAESELVAGFHTEYSGLRWSFFFMAEYGAMFAVSGIAVLLFLGGWHTGFLPELSTLFGTSWLGSAEQPSWLGWAIGNSINVVVFIVKGWLLVFVQMWVRWTLPRLRIDQVMMTCMKYLLPISCVLLMGVSLWQVAINPLVAPYFNYALCALCLILFAWIAVKIVTTPSRLPVSVTGATNLWDRGPIPPELAQKM
jgi:NADH-quinone oxidoreductase subunit H